MEKIKAAIIGAGGFGAHRRGTMRDSGMYDLLGSYDLNPEAMAAAEREDGAKPCGSYEELLELPGLEAVVVSTGGKFHAEQAVAAMRAGKHVFVEKPLCSTQAEVEELYRVKRDTGLHFGVGHNDHSRDPMCKFIREYLENGKIGKLAAIESNSSHSGGLAGSPDNWRFDPDKNPGGMLFQCGVHALHKMMYLFGPVTEVAAFLSYDVHVTRTADVAQTLLRFESGLAGNLNCYHVTAYYHQLRLFGTHGNLYIHTQEGRAWYQERKSGAREIPEEVEVPKGDKEAQKEHRCGNVISFAQAIRGEIEQPWPGLDEGARSVTVVFASEQSYKEGRTVKVELP
jgi:predicted dehydrogenase